MRKVTLGKKLASNINSLTHVKKIPLCKWPCECPLKNTEQNTWNKLVMTLICKQAKGPGYLH